MGALGVVGYGLGVIGAGIGIGLAASGVAQGMARQPEVQGRLFTVFILGLCIQSRHSPSSASSSAFIVK